MLNDPWRWWLTGKCAHFQPFLAASLSWWQMKCSLNNRIPVSHSEAQNLFWYRIWNSIFSTTSQDFFFLYWRKCIYYVDKVSNTVDRKFPILFAIDKSIENVSLYVLKRCKSNFWDYLTFESTFLSLKLDNFPFYLIQSFDRWLTQFQQFFVYVLLLHINFFVYCIWAKWEEIKAFPLKQRGKDKSCEIAVGQKFIFDFIFFWP